MSRVVLSVEDDDATFFLLQMAFRDLGSDFELYRTVDGAEALSFLRRSGTYADAPRPDLVLLNINMPRLSGPEVLEAMKKDKLLETIPAVVFSSSDLDADRARCLALGAKHFISKPHHYEGLVQALRVACGYAQGSAAGAM